MNLLVSSLALVQEMNAGASVSRVVGGFAPAGLNVNNNNDYENENNGLGACRKSC